MSKKIIKLTESDLERIVKRVINETYGGVGFGAEPNGLKIQKMETKEAVVSDLKPGQSKDCYSVSGPIKLNACKSGISGNFRFDGKTQPFFSQLYKVAMGDTISGILRKLNALGVTVDEIIKTNNLKNEKDIRPNDILLIPVNTGD